MVKSFEIHVRFSLYFLKYFRTSLPIKSNFPHVPIRSPSSNQGCSLMCPSSFSHSPSTHINLPVSQVCTTFPKVRCLLNSLSCSYSLFISEYLYIAPLFVSGCLYWNKSFLRGGSHTWASSKKPLFQQYSLHPQSAFAVSVALIIFLILCVCILPVLSLDSDF